MSNPWCSCITGDVYMCVLFDIKQCYIYLERSYQRRFRVITKTYISDGRTNDGCEYGLIYVVICNREMVGSIWPRRIKAMGRRNMKVTKKNSLEIVD